MIAAPFGSISLQLSSDLRIVTKISPGSDTQKKCHPLFPGDMTNTSDRTSQLRQVLCCTDAKHPVYITGKEKC